MSEVMKGAPSPIARSERHSRICKEIAMFGIDCQYIIDYCSIVLKGVVHYILMMLIRSLTV